MGNLIKKDVKYLGRDFAQFRQNLINFAKNYFPDTYQDFNDTSPGMMFMADIEGKGELPITIMDVSDGIAHVFYGHPLAGKSLEFEVEIEEVRQATQVDRSVLQGGITSPS